MDLQAQIQQYLQGLPEPKRSALNALHSYMLQAFPELKLWFLDGLNDKGVRVTHPNIGYGTHLIPYANGSHRPFYQIGFSATSKGISVYFMGISDKDYLQKTYGPHIGKAKITGYCISFATLQHIHIEVLQQAISTAIQQGAIK